MKKTQGILSLLALCGGIAFGVAACSDGAGEACTTDADCTGGGNLVCDTTDNICVETCTSDADCALNSSGFTSCLPRPNVDDGSSVCSRPEMMTTTGCTGAAEAEDADDNAYCARTSGNPDSFCDAGTDMCTTPTAPGAIYRYVQIQDATTGDGCNGTDPGSDIYEVRLEKADGTVIAYANLQDSNTIETSADDKDNLYSSSTRFDGMPGGVTEADACPTETGFENIEPLSLGCDGTNNGTMTVYFNDDNGMIIDLTEGDVVRVYEYSSQCGGSDADVYNVSLCTDTNAVFMNNDTTSCNSEIISTATTDGISAVPLAFPPAQ